MELVVRNTGIHLRSEVRTLVTSIVVFSVVTPYSTLKMEAICSPERLVTIYKEDGVITQKTTMDTVLHHLSMLGTKINRCFGSI
jgi:hypothetical protein